MKKLKRLVCVTILLNIICLSSYGQFMGSEISWRCLGGDSFLIKTTIYYDCNYSPMSKINLNFNCATGGLLITSLSINTPTPLDVTPVCPNSCTRCSNPSCTFPYGIRKYIYQGIVHLNAAGSCCNIRISNYFGSRPSSITTGAASKGFYTEAIMNRCLSPCDNSPEFTNMPVTISCVGHDFSLDNKVIDKDTNLKGKLIDSFTYEFAEPMAYTNGSIPYTGSYTYNKPIFFWGFPNDALPFPRGIHFDPQTGLLQCRPMKAEITVMAVRVKEYRNGVLIGEIRREILLIILPCLNYTPAITSQNISYTKTVCSGDTLILNFSSNDADTSDIITINWNKTIPGAIWTDSNGLTKHPSGTLKWITTDTNVRSLPYNFSITVKDNACPLSASYTRNYQINVVQKPKAKIIVTDSGCGTFGFEAQPIVGSSPTYIWTGNSFIFNPKTGPVTSHTFLSGKYPYVMTISSGGCSSEYFDTINTDPSLILNSLPADTIACIGTTLTINTKVKYNKGPVKMVWGSGKTIFGSTTGLSKTFTFTHDTVIWARATDSTNCSSTDTIRIANKISIKIKPIDKQCINGSIISLNNYVTVNGIFKTGTWSSNSSGFVFGDKFNPVAAGLSSPPGWKVKFEYTEPITGCYNKDSAYISVFALPKPYAGPDDSMCTGYKVSLKGIPSFPSGTWSGIGVGGSLSNWTFNADTTGIANGGTYQLIYRYKDTNQCENEDTMKITVYKTPVVNAGSPKEFCIDASSVTLYGTPSGGIWQGKGVVGNLFFPSTALAGVHDLTYTCSNVICKAIGIVKYSVWDFPVVSANTMSGVKYFCRTNGLIQLNGLPSGGIWSGPGIATGSSYFNTAIGADTPTDYWLRYTYTDIHKCTNKADLTVRVKPEPTVMIDPVGSKMCYRGPYTGKVMYNHADGIFWWKGTQSDGSIVGNPTSTSIGYNPGTNDLTKLNFWLFVMTTHTDNICAATYDSMQVKISALPAPDFSADQLTGGSPLIVQFTDKSTISQGSIIKWEWTFGDGDMSVDQNPLHTYTMPAKYNVKLKVISGAGCENEIIKPGYISTSIDQNQHNTRYLIYPNPAHSELFIEIPGNEPATFKLTDILGKLILEKKINSGKSSINIKAFKPAVYFIFIDGMIAGKLLIE